MFTKIALLQCHAPLILWGGTLRCMGPVSLKRFINLPQVSYCKLREKQRLLIRGNLDRRARNQQKWKN